MTNGDRADASEHAMAPDVRRLRLRAMSDRLRESLLFLPLLLVTGALTAETGLAWLDSHHPLPEPSAVDLPPAAAIGLLTTIAGAMVTTAGVVFSLLVVSLQLASGQFSPRVLRTFWRDRSGQVLIGLLLATFSFCVLALTQLDTAAGRAPALTLLAALGLTVVSVLWIVVYLNRISRQQYVGVIMERIAGEALGLIAELPYGSRVGARVGQPVAQPDLAALGRPLTVTAPADGWVQQISRHAVLASAPAGSVVRLETRVGAFVIAGTPFATVWPAPPATATRAVARGIGEATIIGEARTMQQDVDFALRQLNDIALRALSPAVNDPTTAIEAVLRVTAVMCRLLASDLPAQAVRDSCGRVLLTPYDLDHVECVRHAFGQVLRYGAGHQQVVLAVVRSLRRLREVVESAGGHVDGAGPARSEPAGPGRDGYREEVLAAVDELLLETVAAAEAAGLTASEMQPVRAAAGSSPSAAR